MVCTYLLTVKMKKKIDTTHPGDVRQTEEGCHYNVFCIVSKKQRKSLAAVDLKILVSQKKKKKNESPHRFFVEKKST